LGELPKSTLESRGKSWEEEEEDNNNNYYYFITTYNFLRT
jgi:hypothetical protein